MLEKLQVPPEDQERKEPILNDWDRKYLVEGAVGVINQMREDFGGKFPDFIILPDTGGRPLAYLLGPALREMTHGHDKSVRFLFINMNKKPGYLQRFLELHDEQKPDIQTSQDLKKAITSFNRRHREKISAPDLEVGLKDAHPELVASGREITSERAQEIGEFISQYPDAQMAIVDDFVKSERTFDEIKRAFGGKKIKAYALCSGNPSGPAADSLFEVKAGYYFRDEDWGNSARDSHLAFSFEGNQDAIGVAKNEQSKYAPPQEGETSANTERIALQKKRLREELKVLSEEIVNQIKQKQE